MTSFRDIYMDGKTIRKMKKQFSVQSEQRSLPEQGRSAFKNA
jgi:hypothetical protein